MDIKNDKSVVKPIVLTGLKFLGARSYTSKKTGKVGSLYDFWSVNGSFNLRGVENLEKGVFGASGLACEAVCEWRVWQNSLFLVLIEIKAV